MNSKIKVLVKTFEVLETINREPKLSLKEITERVSLPKPTVFRLLYTLQALGYVDQDSDSQTYTLSSKFISFVSGANRGDGLLNCAKSYMEKLQDEFKETVNLAKLVNGVPTYINILESKQPFRISDNIGDQASFHSTAIGKAIIAYLPKEVREEIFKKYKYIRFTKKTLMNSAQIKKEIEKIKNQGFALDNEEGHDGVICVGTPILDKNNNAIAAISISMPKVRAKKQILEKLKKKLPEIAKEISSKL